jgi:hypothetical protein
MRILIPTYPMDAHAFEIALVLEERGHEAVLWHGSDFPTRGSASLDLRSGSPVGWEIRGPELPAVRPPFDVVWMRRPTPAVLPEDLHPGDRPVAERECREFLGGAYQLAAPDAFWVNPLASRLPSESKAVQLREAAAVGLAIPPTLLSNDPERIRRFLAEFPGQVIYKPFAPAEWASEGRSAVLWTSPVTADDLPPDELLRVTPGIFQVGVAKAHELRVTIMGRHVITARLLSQEVEAGKLDWRAAGSRLGVVPDQLPEAVEAACFRLMERLGILFGAFDFIVTPAGEPVFLEVNSAGQFLWVEEANAEIPTLAPMVDFLLSRDPGFRWQPGPEIPRHRDWYPKAVERIAREEPLHVPAAITFVSQEAEPEEEVAAGV